MLTIVLALLAAGFVAICVLFWLKLFGWAIAGLLTWTLLVPCPGLMLFGLIPTTAMTIVAICLEYYLSIRWVGMGSGSDDLLQSEAVAPSLLRAEPTRPTRRELRPVHSA
jgi:hypothetical protein